MRLKRCHLTLFLKTVSLFTLFRVSFMYIQFGLSGGLHIYLRFETYIQIYLALLCDSISDQNIVRLEMVLKGILAESRCLLRCSVVDLQTCKKTVTVPSIIRQSTGSYLLKLFTSSGKGCSSGTPGFPYLNQILECSVVMTSVLSAVHPPPFLPDHVLSCTITAPLPPLFLRSTDQLRTVDQPITHETETTISCTHSISPRWNHDRYSLSSNFSMHSAIWCNSNVECVRDKAATSRIASRS